MGKRKNEEELVRFVWKRNVKYDVMLLSEVQAKNPFAFTNQKPVWMEIASVLQNGSMKMKVTERSCRDRATDLLKTHRKNERESDRGSGIEEPETTEVQKLLISVAKLQEAKPNKQVKNLYLRVDRSEADDMRAAAVQSVQDSDSDDSDDDTPIVVDSNLNSNNNTNANACNSSSNANNSSSNANNSNATVSSMASTSNNIGSPIAPNRSLPTQGINIFFTREDEDEDLSEQLNSSNKGSSSSRGSNKKDLVRYLENKAEKEIEVRKEELKIRVKEVDIKSKETDKEMEFRKEELKIREKEVEIKSKETENKSKELEILLEKTKAEAEDRKRMNDLMKFLIERK